VVEAAPRRRGLVKAIPETLRRGAVDLVTEAQLAAKLERSRREGRPLRVKFGWDPTAPEVHLGHCVVLRKLRQFQDEGHLAVLILGDTTALVGDPTGRVSARPPVDPRTVEANLARYLEQAGKVVDLERIEVHRNGEWFGAFRFPDFLRLASRATVARLVERDTFRERMGRGEAVGLHELLYPLLQGWDSVAVRADVELGATEQLFNLLVGRDLQGQEGQEPQVCMTMPILPGTDGRKMSKSYGNFIGVLSPPDDLFGKVMSIPDPQLPAYLELLTDLSAEERAHLLSKGRNPRDAKARLAREIVASFHGAAEASRAEAEFDRIFRERRVPTSIPDVVLAPESAPHGRIPVVALLLAAGCATTKSEARRLVAGRGVRIDERVVESAEEEISLPPQGVLLNVGKRKFRRVRRGGS
jgi:tyrosyl-tRNA synthetase